MATESEPLLLRLQSARSYFDKSRKSWLWLIDFFFYCATLPLLALEDLKQDGDHKLLVGDLGSGHYDMKLKMYCGTELTFDTPLLNMPTSVCTFYMDNTEPRTPAVAVASGSFIYIYRNLRPYFKFTLPSLQVHT